MSHAGGAFVSGAGKSAQVPAVSVETLIEEARWREAGLEELAGRACAATLAHLGHGAGFEVSLLGCDDARITALNRQFRASPAPTNVLSWPAEERAAAAPGRHPPPPRGPELGDIAIAFEICAREAAGQGKELPVHVTHLLVHATLHLLGYDHNNAQDAALMEGLEVEILGKLGISDPYEQRDEER